MAGHAGAGHGAGAGPFGRSGVRRRCTKDEADARQHKKQRTDLQLAELPSTIHLFSIARFLLLPGTTLPLTITHLRSQEILDAAEEEGGYLGVILTRPREDRASSRYYEVGGLGRITRLERDEEGHHVTLEGVIRFRVTEELARDEDELPRDGNDDNDRALRRPVRIPEELAGLEGRRIRIVTGPLRGSGRGRLGERITAEK